MTLAYVGECIYRNDRKSECFFPYHRQLTPFPEQAKFSFQIDSDNHMERG